MRSRFTSRIAAVALALLVPMYHVIGLLSVGRPAFVPEVAFDRAVPFSPPWMLAYGSLYVFGFLPLFVIRDGELRRRTVLAYLTAVIVSFAGFLIYPTVGPRPAGWIGEGFLAWCLGINYALDTPYNCFPSLHVAYAFLAALTCYRLHRGLGFAAGLWASLIGVATLFTKQHYVVDVIAGVAIAFVAYAVFLRGYPREAVSKTDRRRAPMRALGAVAVYGIVIVCFLVAYQTRG